MMKKLLAATVLVLTFSGCIPIEFEKNKSMSFSVNAYVESDNAPLEATVDLSQDEDFKQYSKYISEIAVQSATVTVTATNTKSPSLCTKTGGVLTVQSVGGTDGVQFAAYEDLALTEGNSKDLVLDDAGKAKIGALLLGADRKLTIKAAGLLDQYPCHFDFKVDVNLKVKAKAGL